MFTRFLGEGNIGHHQQVPAADSFNNMVGEDEEEEEDAVEATPSLNITTFRDEPLIPDGLGSHSDVEADSDHDDELVLDPQPGDGGSGEEDNDMENPQDVDEDDLGPEDGEEPWVEGNEWW
jgi:hypothetical protein